MTTTPTLTEVPPGYRLAVVAPNGAVVDTIDIAGYDLRRSVAALDVTVDVMAAIERAEERVR
jgi:hypothetical protein